MDTSPYDEAVDLHRRRRLGEAIAAYDRAAASEPGRARVHANRARCLIDLGRIKEAISAARRAVRLDGKDSYAHTVLIEALSIGRRSKDVLAAMARAARVETPPLQREIQLIRLTHALVALEHADAALAAASRATALAPGDPRAHVACAVALASACRFGEARTAMARAVSLAPGDELVRSRQATIEEGFRMLEASLAEAGQAAVTAPESGERWKKVGHLLILLGRFDDAAGAFDRAIALRPRDAEAWFGKGTALQRAGRFPEDVLALKKAGRLAQSALNRQKRIEKKRTEKNKTVKKTAR